MAIVGTWQVERATRGPGEVAWPLPAAAAAGTFELIVRSGASGGATLAELAVPGRDRAVFSLATTGSGGIVLTALDAAGRPRRFRTRDGIAAAGERLQVTLCWSPAGGALTCVNLDALARDPRDPAAGHVGALPPGALLPPAGPARLILAAPESASALVPEAGVERATLSDTQDGPGIPAPSARVLPFRRRRRGAGRARPGTAQSGGAPGRVIRVPGTAAAASRPACLVATTEGDRPVASLKAGDRVLTRDHGAVPVQAALRIELDLRQIARRPDLAPRLIPAGALGHGPTRDVLVGPFQRAGAADAAARPIPVPGPGGLLAYTHLLFAKPVSVRINGIWVEMDRPARLPEGLRARLEGSARRVEAPG